MPISEIGCCGAYCGTCSVFKAQACKGCKLGYENELRDIKYAKCKMKVCCITKKLQSCAECSEYDTCIELNGFYNKNGYKYKKYRQATAYIKTYGYDEFLEVADKWGNAYGKYEL